jgi:hypothetical protein
MSTRICDSLAARELLSMLRQATTATASPAVHDAVATLTAALDGDALSACLALQVYAPHDLPAFETELYSAAISIGGALRHVETTTDATEALDAAQRHLHAALDAHGDSAGAA